MPAAMDIALQHAETSPTRVPLLEKLSNSPPPTDVRQLRRKTSFAQKVDSSESCSGPQDSIYEAHYFSSTNSDESCNQVEHLQMVASKGTDTPISNMENQPTFQPSTAELPNANIEFRYGNGTILETITEQQSNGTMRSLFQSRSANDLRERKSIPTLERRDSTLATKSLRRKQSFSLDDISLINRSYHDACAIIERTARKPLPIYEIYASPKVPVSGPLERPLTPPGVPSWTAGQVPTPTTPRRYHVPGAPNRLQRFLGIEPSGVTLSSRVPAPGATRIVSAPVTAGAGRIAPRFRPPRSVYGPLDRHPFYDCPVATLSKARSPNKKVRFTPSTTARDSAEHTLRTAIESTSASAVHPLAPILPIPQPGFALTKSKLCLHRHPLQSIPGNCGSSRTTSVASTVPLMSGALPSTFMSTAASPTMSSPDLAISLTNQAGAGEHGSTKSFQRLVPCWKCLLERAARFWAHATSCLCFMCCGFECDDESAVYPAGYGIATDSGYFDNHGMDGAGQRRMVLEQTPASMV